MCVKNATPTAETIRFFFFFTVFLFICCEGSNRKNGSKNDILNGSDYLVAFLHTEIIKWKNIFLSFFFFGIRYMYSLHRSCVQMLLVLIYLSFKKTYSKQNNNRRSSSRMPRSHACVCYWSYCLLPGTPYWSFLVLYSNLKNMQTYCTWKDFYLIDEHAWERQECSRHRNTMC